MCSEHFYSRVVGRITVCEEWQVYLNGRSSVGGLKSPPLKNGELGLILFGCLLLPKLSQITKGKTKFNFSY